jgi:hypothetical protein
MKSPTLRHRAVELLRCYGWTVEVVEHFERPPGRPAYRKDLFGFADLLAVRPGQTLAVQVSSPRHVPQHFRKLAGIPAVGACLAAGWSVEIWGIRKRPDKHGSGVMFRALSLDGHGRLVSRDATNLKG